MVGCSTGDLAAIIGDDRIRDESYKHRVTQETAHRPLRGRPGEKIPGVLKCFNHDETMTDFPRKIDPT